MSNLEEWDQLKQPPEASLKKITGGRLSGKSDINPQWRYQALTEVYGPCGSGWRYEIDRTWTEAGTDGQVFVFSHVSLFVVRNGKWSAAIPATGGSMLIEKENSGHMHCNDEAVKMSVTDALGTAAKMLGVAADVYLGNWDGSKYRNQPEPLTKPRKEPAKPKPISEMGWGDVHTAFKASGWPKEKTECLLRMFGLCKTAAEIQKVDELAMQADDVDYVMLSTRARIRREEIEVVE